MRVPRRQAKLPSIIAGAAGCGLIAAACLPQTGLAATATPIQHIVVIFQENVSFDHYFATYPDALNSDGQTFNALAGTPTVNGLSGSLLTNNPNLNPANGSDATNPFRLAPGEASTCDQDHNYGHEQMAFDGGLMDLFPATVGVGENTYCAATYAWGKGKGLVMGYYDGNTVTALWNYAQHFAMSDNSYGTTFGPSTPGALNLIAGNTYPAKLHGGTSPKVAAASNGGIGTLVGDLDPYQDVCSHGTTVRLAGKNIGDLLNDKGVTWGAFMGGFDLTETNANNTTGCDRSSPATAANGGPTKDYIPHHAWFQYYASTENKDHTRPSSVALIGTSGDGAHHEYALHDFFDALAIGNMPAVSFIKAPAYADGHAGYSDPLLEQTFLVDTINAIMQSPFWSSTAIVIAYDDSDGWYDHQMSTIVNPSAVAPIGSDTKNSDQLNGPGVCGSGTPLSTGNGAGSAIQGRCGYGPRLPLLVISPYAKQNFVDHTLTDQSSILRFIEDNWSTGRIGGGSFDALAGPLSNMLDFSGATAAALVLDPSTGQPAP